MHLPLKKRKKKAYSGLLANNGLGDFFTFRFSVQPSKVQSCPKLACASTICTGDGYDK